MTVGKVTEILLAFKVYRNQGAGTADLAARKLFNPRAMASLSEAWGLTQEEVVALLVGLQGDCIPTKRHPDSVREAFNLGRQIRSEIFGEETINERN